ncbi:type II secretion system protein GspM [Ralstonia solanacearum]|uniref:type II secretion system protein GspM n=1 Tax=Ralstonia solanacearum TaxID=305 RepID=UPI001E54A4EA|nr:type II secretion system protein GspM [Ralstonia solanacearum]
MATSSNASNASAARRRLPRIGVPDALRDAATAFWMQREPRERRILAGGGAILLLVIVYLLFWEPAFEGRRRIEKALPEMRGQLAEMETLGQEAHELSAIAAAPVPHGNDLQDALNASLTAHGLKASRMALSGESVQVQLDKVPFGAVAEWLQEVRQAQRMKVIDAGIRYVGATALVNVTATLQGPSAGAGGH